MKSSRQYPRIRNLLYTGIWAIKPDVLHSMINQFEAHVAGGLGNKLQVLPDDESDPESQNDPNKKYYKTYQTVYGTTAVIEVNGILGKRLGMLELLCGGCDVDNITRALLQARQDPEVTNIVLYYNSPGGVITGIEPLGELIRQTDQQYKPVYSYCDVMACSAGFWLYSQGRARYASVDAELGSIGVYTYLVDATAYYKKEGLEFHPISAGADKLLGADFLTPTKEQLQFLQDGVDRSYATFKSKVSETMNISFDKTGARTYSAGESLDMGLGLCDGGIINQADDAFNFINSLDKKPTITPVT